MPVPGLIYGLSARLSGGLYQRSVDLLVGEFAHLFDDGAIDSLIDRLVDCWVDFLTDWATGRFVGKSIWEIDRPGGRSIY